MNQSANKRKPLRYLAKVGPPNSEAPQDLNVLLIIKIPTPRMETKLYKETVKPRLPLATLKVEP